MRRNPELAHEISRKLSSVDGVTHVDMQPVIGGVTVHYEHQAADSVEFFVKLAAAFGLGALEVDQEEIAGLMKVLSGAEEASGETATELLQGVGTTIDTAVQKLTQNGLHMGLLLPLVLTALGVRSLFVSEQLKAPSWYELFWFAFGAYYTLNKPESPGDAAT
jgi:hypothetical protein